MAWSVKYIITELAAGEDYTEAVRVMDQRVRATALRLPKNDPLSADIVLDDILDAEFIDSVD